MSLCSPGSGGSAVHVGAARVGESRGRTFGVSHRQPVNTCIRSCHVSSRPANPPQVGGLGRQRGRGSLQRVPNFFPSMALHMLYSSCSFGPGIWKCSVGIWQIKKMCPKNDDATHNATHICWGNPKILFLTFYLTTFHPNCIWARKTEGI